MKVCVVGCGAIGSIFAGHLARLEDVQVFAFDLNREHVGAINANGLRLSGEADFISRPLAFADPGQLPHCDFGLVVTKSMHTRAAVESVSQVFDSDSAVCSVQNGVGNEEIIAEFAAHVIRGTTFPAGHVVEPGHVCYDIQGSTWIGPFEPSATPMPKVLALAELLNRAGLHTIPLEDAKPAQWTKLIFNASTNPVGALTRLHHGAATFFEPTGRLFERLIDEGVAVATALGISLDGDPKEMVRKAANAPGKHNASMLQDILAGRPTEVDFMNGAIVRFGRKQGVPTPLNQAMWALVKGLEHSWTKP